MEWPVQYQLLQAGVVVLAVTQLHLTTGLAPFGDGDTHPTVAGLLQSIRLFSMLEPLRGAVYLIFCWAILRLGTAWDRKHGGLWGTGQRGVPLWKVMLGNIGLYAVTLILDCALTSVIDCGGAVWSDVPATEQVRVLVEKWHLYVLWFGLVPLTMRSVDADIPVLSIKGRKGCCAALSPLCKKPPLHYSRLCRGSGRLLADSALHST